MLDDREIKVVLITEDKVMAAIDTEIMEVASTLDKNLRETNTDPVETNDADLSQPNTTTKTTRQVYNL